MFRITAGFLGFLFLGLVPSSLSAQGKLSLFGGYSYLTSPVPVVEQLLSVTAQNPCEIACPTFNATNRQSLNGWELSGTYHLLPFLGVTADFSGHYGTAVSGTSSSAHQYSYLFGPEVSFPARVSPFAHVLIGAAHQTVGSGDNSTVTIFPGSNSGFATVVGVGVDLKIVPHIWIRPIQMDYMVARLAGGTQNEARFSAGIVLRF